MKLSSKYMEKPEVKLYMISTVFPHKNHLLFKKTKKPVSWRMQYSLYNPTSTMTHTRGSALANRYNPMEVEVKSKKAVQLHVYLYTHAQVHYTYISHVYLTCFPR